MKTNKDKYRGNLELDTLDQLNSIVNDILDTRGLAIILNQYFDESRRTEQEHMYEYYGVLNVEIMQRLLDLAEGLRDIVSEIDVKRWLHD